MNKRNLIIGIIILIALVGGVVLWSQSNNWKQQNKQDWRNVKPIDLNEVKDLDTSNWKIYRDKKYGFEVKYPEGWEVKIHRFKVYDYFTFGEARCIENDYEDEDCYSKFAAVGISKGEDKGLDSNWYWNVPEYRCGKDNNEYIYSFPISPLEFDNISYPIKACDKTHLGYRWQGYMFTKDGKRWLLKVRYTNPTNNTPIPKNIIKSFKFTSDNN